MKFLFVTITNRHFIISFVDNPVFKAIICNEEIKAPYKSDIDIVGSILRAPIILKCLKVIRLHTADCPRISLKIVTTVINPCQLVGVGMA